jgi:hypothetical protein
LGGAAKKLGKERIVAEKKIGGPRAPKKKAAGKAAAGRPAPAAQKAQKAYRGKPLPAPRKAQKAPAGTLEQALKNLAKCLADAQKPGAGKGKKAPPGELERALRELRQAMWARMDPDAQNGEQAPAGKPAPAPGRAQKAPAGKPAKKEAPLCALRIELKGVKPKIWREFFVPFDISLHDLHEVILRVMGWTGYHLYAFSIGGVEHINPEDDPGGRVLAGDSRKTPLARTFLNRLGLGKGSSFAHEYDFGDGWEHKLKVLDTDFRPADPSQRCGCYAGERACPPEDCGGPWGYAELLAALADPSHPEHEEMTEWVEESCGEFDPEFCDLDEINQAIAWYAAKKMPRR